MYKKRLSGVVIPTITPMNEDGSIDERSLANFTEYLVQAGVDCLYPNGTNGESLLLSQQERESVAEIMVKTAANRIPVFIQCGSMTTAETVSHVQHAARIGADGVGVMSPAFFPMDEASLFGYYSAVIESVPREYPVYGQCHLPAFSLSVYKSARASRGERSSTSSIDTSSAK